MLLQVETVTTYDFIPKGNFYMKKITIVNVEWNIMQAIKWGL